MNIEEDKELIKRIDGIEYYRKKREIAYDLKITIRITKSTIEELKKIAESKNIGYQTIIRSLIEEYIEKNKVEQ